MSHLHATHDWTLVSLSLLMPVLTSYAAFDLAGRAKLAAKARSRHAWLVAAAGVMGGGIWSMHFVAMLAFQIPGVAIGYNPMLTSLSLVLAVLVTGSSFFVLHFARGGLVATFPAGIFMGLGIVIMHYVGMEALRIPATLAHDMQWVAIAVAMAVVASIGSLWLSFRHSSFGVKAVGAVVAGIAVAGMHYAAMEGIEIVPAGSMAGREAVIERRYILAAVASMTFAILVTTFIASIVDRRMTAAMKKEADALRESEERFRFLYRNAPMALYTLDNEARIEDVSDGWLELFGYAREEVIGRPIFGILSADIREMAKNVKWPSTLKGVEARESEYRMLTKDDRELDVIINSRVEFDQAGQFRRVMCAVIDVTARKKAEQALVQAQKMEAFGRLTGGIAHDFNNLLAVVKGNLGLLAKRLNLEGKEKAWLENAIEATRRGVSLTQRMLTFARRQELTTAAVDLHSLTGGIGEMIQRSIGPRHLLRTQVPEGLPLVAADANQTELALLNLCINARDAMPSGGQIVVEAREEGDYVCLAVVDTGVGMDERTLAQATEPFFTTKGPGKGTGLGLPMVMGLAEQSGGRLVLKSSPGAGTTAEIWLRKYNASAQPAPAAPEAQAPASFGQLSILVVDDDTLVGWSTADMLEEAGHVAVLVSSGKDALEALSFEAPKFDMLVTDLAMPEMDGLAVAREVAERWPDLPIIIVTGYSEHPVPRSLAWKLTKPFTQEALIAAVRQTWCARKKAQGARAEASGSSPGSTNSDASAAMSNNSA